MRIVLFHPVHLPPRDYGGVERVVLWLARGLIEQGHDVWVGALKGSALADGVRLLEIDACRTSVGDLIPLLPKGIDIVHFMAPPEPEALRQLSCSFVLTVHGNGKSGEVFPKNSVFLSRDHARRHGAETFVYNGIDPAEYVFDPSRKTDRYLFFSKTSWKVKNLSGAIGLCSRAGVKLDVAGGHRPLLQRFRVFCDPRMRWIGPVNGARKARALAEAKALVFPILWPEPFGLVIAEALMSGTPVLAAKNGSVTELIPSDVGAVVEDDDVWMEWLSQDRLPWSPERCRAWALEKFHYIKMTDCYLSIYQKVLGGNSLHSCNPIAGDWRNS